MCPNLTHTHTHTELRTFGTQLEHAMLEESQATPQPTVHPQKTKLPPLPTLQPRPPSKANYSSQALVRASQVRKKDSKTNPALIEDTAQGTYQCQNESASSTAEQCLATGCDNQLHTDQNIITHTEVCDRALSHSHKTRSSQPRTRDSQLELHTKTLSFHSNNCT